MSLKHVASLEEKAKCELLLCEGFTVETDSEPAGGSFGFNM